MGGDNRVVHGDRRRAAVWYREAAYIGKDGVDEGFAIEFSTPKRTARRPSTSCGRSASQNMDRAFF